MLTSAKWPVLFVGVAVATMLTSGSYAQQSSPGNVSSPKSANYIQPTNQARRSIAICSHRAGCQYCCYFPDSQSSTCVFDVRWCGQ